MSIIKPRCLACFGAINFGGDDSTDRITQCGHVLCAGCAQYHAAQRNDPSVVDCPVCRRQTATTKLNVRGRRRGGGPAVSQTTTPSPAPEPTRGPSLSPICRPW